MVYDSFERRLNDFLEMMLEDMTFEEFIENFDISASEVFQNMYDSGLIDDGDLKKVGFPG